MEWYEMSWNNEQDWFHEMNELIMIFERRDMNELSECVDKFIDRDDIDAIMIRMGEWHHMKRISETMKWMNEWHAWMNELIVRMHEMKWIKLTNEWK